MNCLAMLRLSRVKQGPHWDLRAPRTNSPRQSLQRAGQAEEGSTRGTSDLPDVHSGDAQPTAPQVRDPKAAPIQGWEQSQRGVREGKTPENKGWSKWPREESGKGKHQKKVLVKVAAILLQRLTAREVVSVGSDEFDPSD
ncbi:hypothetical protein ACOMHN_038686 [Nucella lapillus]